MDDPNQPIAESGSVSSADVDAIKADLRDLADSSLPPKRRLAAAGRCREIVQHGLKQREFVRARGIAILIDVTTEQWPAGGNLVRSKSPLDKVVTVEASSNAGNRPTSLRQEAAALLSDCSLYAHYVEAMYDAGLFDRMPGLLADVVPRYKRDDKARHKPMLHSVPQHLMQLCAAAAAHRRHGKAVVQCCALPAAKAYNPVTMGEAAEVDRPQSFYLVEAFCKLMAFTSVLTREQQDEVLDAGAFGKVDICTASSMTKMRARAALHAPYERHLARLQAAARAQREQQAALAAELRQKGNDAFRAGEYKAAAGWYSKALALTQQDGVLYANRSLCLLKLDRAEDALEDAELAVTFQPMAAKYWARCGDAYSALGNPSCALLCFEQAHDLAGSKNEDIAGRLEAARHAVPPSERIDVSKMPLDYRAAVFGANPALRSRLNAAYDSTDEIQIDRATAAVAEAGSRAVGAAPGVSMTSHSNPRGRAAECVMPLIKLVASARALPSVPRRVAVWNASWSDMPTNMTGRNTWQQFSITVMEGAEMRTCVMRPGKPTAAAIIQAITLGMTHPEAPGARPGRPLSIMPAYRMLSEWEELEAALTKLGVQMVKETRQAAEVSAYHNNTDPDGYNFAEDDP